MPDLGKYAVEVISAYIATFVILGGLIGLTIMRSKRVKRALEAAEARARSDG